MTNHSEEGVCKTTCCGNNDMHVEMRQACSPIRSVQKEKTEQCQDDNVCNEQDMVSLPNLHDIYCMKESKPTSVFISPTKPKISPKNELRLKQKEEDVFQVFRQMLQLYKADEIMFAFNGGKDCTVVLDMISRFYRMVCLSNIEIPVLYVYNNDSFEEMDEFVENCSKRYPIELIKYNGFVKEALSEFLRENTMIKACVMGLRSSDPYCKNLQIMQFTDSDWPPLMRVNPILDWTYCDVWNYLLYYNVPYCPLYNQGFTSIGNKSNTVRNDLLKCNQAICKNVYFPAYELIDGSMERVGRVSLSAGGFKKAPESSPNHES